jgi:hypothetical protein
MNFKTTYILFGVFLVVLGTFALILLLTPSKPVDQTYVFPTLHDPKEPVATKDIDSVVVEHVSPKGEKTVFEHNKDNERWSMTEPFALREVRVDKNAVDALVRDVMEARKDPKADVNNNLSQWGLDNPTGTITLRKGDKEWKLNLGKKVETKGGQTSVVYVNTSQQPKEVMAVGLRSLESTFKPVNDFRAKEVLADNPSEIQSVTLHNGKHDPVILQRTTGNRWKIAQPAYGEADYEGEAAAEGGVPGAKSSPSVRSLLDILTALRVQKNEDFVSEDSRNLEQYGLAGDAKPGQLRIEVNRTMGGFGADKEKKIQQTLRIGKKVDEKDPKSEQYYAMLEDEKHVFKITANFKPLEDVLDNPSTLRNRDLVHVEEPRVDVVALKNENGKFELFKAGESFMPLWKLFREGQPPQTADGAAVDALLRAVTAKRLIKEFPDPKSDEKTLGFDQPTAVLSLWTDGIQKEEKKEEEKKDEAKEGDKKDSGKKDDKKDEKKEEKKDPNAKPRLKSDKPSVKLTFGKRDRAKGVLYVRREGIGEDETMLLGAVPDTLFDKVTEGPLAFLDKSLPPWTGEVTKLILERNGQTYEMEKEKDKPDWKITQPKEWAGRSANQVTISGIIGDLQHLRAEKLITEKATPEQEQQYGLKTPRLKATLTAMGADKKPEEHVYLFGDEVKDDKGNVTGVYAKEAKNSLVFTVPKSDVDPLQGELRDPTVFHFDAAKAKGLKVTGWTSTLGSPITLALERKGGTWTVQASPVQVTLDQNKVEDFVNALSHLRADKFLDPKGEPKPEKMDVKDDALQIEVTVEGEKDPYLLTVGGEAPDKEHYFASSNRLPNEYILVGKKPFDEARSKLKYFTK